MARNQEKLDRAKEQLLRINPSVMVHVYSKDLAMRGAAEELVSQLKSDGLQISIFINNAGFGLLKPFHETTLDTDILQMIELNITSGVTLTRLLLPDMIQR